jgi:peptidoglycan/LPS O-acetylase OafA/YrhL
MWGGTGFNCGHFSGAVWWVSAGACSKRTRGRMPHQPPTFFQPRLEALRGYAALMVAYAHSLGAAAILSPESARIKQWLAILGNGGVGVTIFFVLSGYVLSLSLSRSGPATLSLWWGFVLRRFLRIFPAMLVCLLFCFVWVNWVHVPQHFQAASRDYYLYWNAPVSLLELIKDLAFISNRLNPVTWTLQVEMLAGMAFVPLWLLGRKSRWLAVLLLTVWIGYFWLAPLYSFARSGFIFMFILGMLVKPATEWLQRYCMPRQGPKLALLAFLLCCLVNKLIPETASEAWVLEALLAYLLIASLGHGNQQGSLPVMDHRLPRFIGTISYSFYLWHFPVLFISGTWLFSVVPGDLVLSWPNLFQNVLFVVSAACAIPVAWLSYRYVETPFLRWVRAHGQPGGSLRAVAPVVARPVA